MQMRYYKVYLLTCSVNNQFNYGVFKSREVVNTEKELLSTQSEANTNAILKVLSFTVMSSNLAGNLNIDDCNINDLNFLTAL